MTPTWKRAIDLQTGDILDLEGDCYADPANDNIGLQCELALVGSIEQTGIGVIVYTDTVNFACPHDHLVRVCGFDPRAESF